MNITSRRVTLLSPSPNMVRKARQTQKDGSKSPDGSPTPPLPERRPSENEFEYELRCAEVTEAHIDRRVLREALRRAAQDSESVAQGNRGLGRGRRSASRRGGAVPAAVPSCRQRRVCSAAAPSSSVAGPSQPASGSMSAAVPVSGGVSSGVSGAERLAVARAFQEARHMASSAVGVRLPVSPRPLCPPLVLTCTRHARRVKCRGGRVSPGTRGRPVSPAMDER